MDRVVAVVNNQAILKSDVDWQVRLAVLEPGTGTEQALRPQQALDQLISRELIEQAMRREDSHHTEPGPEQVEARVKEMRHDLPACARRCVSDEGWAGFLAEHALTEARVENYVRERIEVLAFIEQRFRQGIRVTTEETENYYKRTLLPQYAPGAEIPPIEKVAPRIEEILLQQRVNALFEEWLRSLRLQGEIEVLDPALESPQEAGQTPGGGEGQ